MLHNIKPILVGIGESFLRKVSRLIRKAFTWGIYKAENQFLVLTLTYLISSVLEIQVLDFMITISFAQFAAINLILKL